MLCCAAERARVVPVRPFYPESAASSGPSMCCVLFVCVCFRVSKCVCVCVSVCVCAKGQCSGDLMHRSRGVILIYGHL